jgi:hypothetical protein
MGRMTCNGVPFAPQSAVSSSTCRARESKAGEGAARAPGAVAVHLVFVVVVPERCGAVLQEGCSARGFPPVEAGIGGKVNVAPNSKGP